MLSKFFGKLFDWIITGLCWVVEMFLTLIVWPIATIFVALYLIIFDSPPKRKDDDEYADDVGE